MRASSGLCAFVATFCPTLVGFAAAAAAATHRTMYDGARSFGDR